MFCLHSRAPYLLIWSQRNSVAVLWPSATPIAIPTILLNYRKYLIGWKAFYQCAFQPFYFGCCCCFLMFYLFTCLFGFFFFLSKNWHKIKKVQWSPRNTTSISLAKNYLRLFVPTSSSLTLVSCMAWWISPCQTSITGDRSFRQSDYHLSKSITGIMSNQW